MASCKPTNLTTSNVHVYLDTEYTTDEPLIIIGYEDEFRFTYIDEIQLELTYLLKHGGWPRSHNKDNFGTYLGTLDQLPELFI